MRQNEPAGPVCVTWRVNNVLGQLPIPCSSTLSTVVLFVSNFEFHNPVYMVYQ